MGKPKGLNQVAWERGLLDPSRTYTKHNLVDILKKCTDFENAETNLQMIARSLGVTAERTPKFHCEMAGEGIEYDWAFSKQKYRCRPLADKKGRTRFHELVREVTSWSFLHKAQTRRSSARARSYISGYYNIHFNNGSLLQEETPDEQVLTEDEAAAVVNVVDSTLVAGMGGGGEGTATGEPWKPDAGEVIPMYIIEKAKRRYHSHRGVNTFEKGTYAG